MSFHVIAPPSDIKVMIDNGKTIDEAVEHAGANIAEIAKPVWLAAKKLGLTLDVPGFLYAWIGGTRVLVEKDDKGEIATVAFMTVGRKWTANDNSATVLELAGRDPQGMLEFAKQIAAALGARVLYHEDHRNQRPDGIVEHVVLEYRVG